MIFRILICSVYLLTAISGFTQVELSKETTKKEKQKKVTKSEKSEKELSSTGAFVLSNWSFTNRKLIENEGLFGDSLGYRANETGLNTWSFGIGLRSQFHSNFAWEGGISYMKNGEQYLYEEVDTMYSYRTKYTYFAMPIKLYFTYGEKLKFLAGVGVVPQMFAGYQQEVTWRDSEGKEESSSSKLKIGYNSFVISTVFNIGLQYDFTRRIGVFLMPEYRIQLTSSYLKTSSYKHYGRSLGGNIGLIINL